MNILTIAQRIITQIVRDKRTLMLLFVAPVLLLTLLHYIFQTVDDGKVKVGIYHIPSALSEQLEQHNIKQIKISSDEHIKQTIESQNLDAVLITQEDKTDVYYENIDPAKKMKVKQAIEAYKIKAKFSQSQVVITEMQQKFEAMQQQLEKMQQQIAKLGPLLKRVGIDMPEMNKNEKIKQPAQDETIKDHYIYGDQDSNYFDMINPVLIAFFVFFFTFLISGITLLKERTTGTLYKLLSTPIKRSEIVLGYMLGFSLFATIQTVILVIYAVYVLKIHVEGSLLLFIMSNIMLAFVALGLGLLISTFAKSEFQMIQFIPLIIVPQILFSGLIPIENMHRPLQLLSYTMPLKYGADNLNRIMIKGQAIEIMPNIIVLLVLFALLMVANIILLKRYRNI
ncbi:ABC transporter permease [Macrococcus capreoli]|uniref:ABC transporter permease n=1 Tax=Macrococcus capreoli TaxID=2982690 RepID=UPI0021D5A52C|nr:ABC transporter permease [Macrococcus sp. TMW 2.2395]MCU7557496.1 ABC transporter permease [Macrococcus sp. TMW 2.2395]